MSTQLALVPSDDSKPTHEPTYEQLVAAAGSQVPAEVSQEIQALEQQIASEVVIPLEEEGQDISATAQAVMKIDRTIHFAVAALLDKLGITGPAMRADLKQLPKEKSEILKAIGSAKDMGEEAVRNVKRRIIALQQKLHSVIDTKMSHAIYENDPTSKELGVSIMQHEGLLLRLNAVNSMSRSDSQYDKKLEVVIGDFQRIFPGSKFNKERPDIAIRTVKQEISNLKHALKVAHRNALHANGIDFDSFHRHSGESDETQAVA